MLQLIYGDLWEHHHNGDIIAITTGALIDNKGRCAMPKGCARQAADQYPDLPYILAEQIKKFGSHVFDIGHKMVSFPVEPSPFENPEIKIINQSCKELVELTNYKGWQRVVVPRPGCVHGGLSWNEVKPLLELYFDQRFHVITREVDLETS